MVDIEEYYKLYRDMVAKKKANNERIGSGLTEMLPESENYNPHIDITLERWVEIRGNKKPQVREIFRKSLESGNRHAKPIQREIARKLRIYMSNTAIVRFALDEFEILLKNEVTGKPRAYPRGWEGGDNQ
ncbi:MAG: hypothetical protein ACTSWQ_05025 [Candidatus Thorarchaeota archaeon]